MHSDLQDLRSPSARAPGLIVPIGGQDTPLSLRLRQGTRQAHRNIERMALVRGMLRGVLRQATYRRMLIDLYPVYSALEWGLSHNAHHPAVASIFEPRLWRGTAIAADLTFLDLRMGCDRGWQHTPPSAAAQRYAAHLTHLALTQPALLLGHAYTRFLGDLSGGQILRRIIATTLRLDQRGGLAFYTFDQIADVAQFRDQFRARLDRAPLSPTQADAVVAQAIDSFAHSAALFAALATDPRD